LVPKKCGAARLYPAARERIISEYEDENGYDGNVRLSCFFVIINQDWRSCAIIRGYNRNNKNRINRYVLINSSIN
jgi:hypothetical protein